MANPEERQDAFVARLRPRRLYELAGEDMRLCLNMTGSGRQPERLAPLDFVTDANRTHSVTPIRNPGGHLRALTQRHKAGQLNLIGSLIGLAERRDVG